jgi:acetyltransferase-like isoleucine patch superfamily enzyme
MAVTIAETAVVYPETVFEGAAFVDANAVVGKRPVLSRRSSARRRHTVDPLVVGEGVSILAGAVVFAASSLGRGVIVGDQVCVRERSEVGADSVIGRGVLIENDVTIGARCRIQANAYITAYTVVEDDVVIAPGVVTTNDNYMGRTERRISQMKGATIRRGARVGGGAVLLPGVHVGEEAVVGAGAVVLNDVPPRAVVVGNPARQLRNEPPDEPLP